MEKKSNIKANYHHENLKDALIDTCLVILEKEGLESITLRKVAALTGSSRTAIYRHFDSKEHLLQSVILKGFSKLNDILDPILLEKTSDAQVRLREMGRAYINFARDNKALYRLMLGDKLSLTREAECSDELTPVNTGFDSLASLLKEGQQQKVFIDGNVKIQSSSIWAIIHGQASLLIDGHLMIQKHEEEILNETLDVVIRGYLR